jgi:hypothetical protein
MNYQADQWIHPMNIQWVSGLSDSIIQTILNGLSGGPMDTPNEYSVSIRLIRLDHPDNIGMGCPPDQWIH